MAMIDIAQTTTTDASLVTDSTIKAAHLDVPQDQDETFYQNTSFSSQLGIFKSIPQYNRAISALSFWSVGGGYTTDNTTQVILDNIIGRGDSDFISILKNMLKTKNYGEDAYAHIMRNKDTGTLVNLKPLNTGNMRIIYGRDGMIKRYEQTSVIKGNDPKPYETSEILHLSHDPTGDEMHGTSTADLVEWVVTAKKEAMEDWKRISHLSTVRILYIDIADKAKLSDFKRDYPEAIKKGHLLILPINQKDAKFEDLQLPPVEAFLAWMRYLDNFFYSVVGVPKVIADAEGFTEAGGKMSFLTFEPVYVNEQKQLESDLWNQLAIRVKFNRPPSLSGVVAQDEEKNAGQVGIQPNDTQAGVGE